MEKLRMMNKKGNILIAFVIITFLVLAALVEFCSWVQQSTRANVHRIATQKALMNADTGIQSALEFLRTPQAAGLKAGISWPLTSVEQGTTFYVDLIRRASDTSLVDVYATRLLSSSTRWVLLQLLQSGGKTSGRLCLDPTQQRRRLFCGDTGGAGNQLWKQYQLGQHLCQ